jgi:hypothetical protein
MVWLGARRGYLLDALTQVWVCGTGKRFDLVEYPWLDGPVGDAERIGKDFFERLADRQGAHIREGSGLLTDISDLFADPESRLRLSSNVVDFYERTARYGIDARSAWTGGFRPCGRLLAAMFSRRLEQLNVPLHGFETSQGMTSQILDIIDRNGRTIDVAWVRTLKGTGRVVYCGTYSVCIVPGFRGACLKVCFPLPNGSATVILWPRVEKDGSLTLTSSGERFGDPGFYFIVHRDGVLFARYVRAMRERIRVYVGGDGEVRANHALRLFGKTFLQLHYRLTPI